jgi:hypothetical protein
MHLRTIRNSEHGRGYTYELVQSTNFAPARKRNAARAISTSTPRTPEVWQA